MQKFAFIIGCQKCGTTALKYYLNQHPDTFVLNHEGHFFDSDNIDIEVYKKWFAGKNKLCIDKSPSYIFKPIAIKRIKRYYPDARIIVMVRDPADRAYSEYQMQRLNGTEKNSFDYTIRNEPKDYLQRGMYASQLKELYKYFDKEQVLVITAEMLKAEPYLILSRVFKHLNLSISIDGIKALDLSERHVGGSARYKSLQRVTAILENLRLSLQPKLSGNGATFIYKLISFFMLHIKLINKKRGYEPMNQETRMLIYNQLKDELHELRQMEGIVYGS